MEGQAMLTTSLREKLWPDPKAFALQWAVPPAGSGYAGLRTGRAIIMSVFGAIGLVGLMVGVVGLATLSPAAFVLVPVLGAFWMTAQLWRALDYTMAHRRTYLLEYQEKYGDQGMDDE